MTRVKIGACIAYLFLRNLVSQDSLLGEADVDVSLTTYGRRTQLAFLAIESIGRGVKRPRTMTLWLDDERVLRSPPASIRRLVKRGLMLELAPDYGPHKKYYPHCVSRELVRALVTADDDAIYPRHWLGDLVSTGADAMTVVCHRARQPGYDDSGRLTPYATWGLCESAEAVGMFPTGVGGVLYPPNFQQEVRKLGDAFMEVTPSADDVWLYWIAERQGFNRRQCRDRASEFWPIPTTTRHSLALHNVLQNANDDALERVRLYFSAGMSEGGAPIGTGRLDSVRMPADPEIE